MKDISHGWLVHLLAVLVRGRLHFCWMFGNGDNEVSKEKKNTNLPLDNLYGSDIIASGEFDSWFMPPLPLL